MISRKSVKVLICLGGVVRAENANQGIDEKIKIARKYNKLWRISIDVNDKI